MRRVRFTNRFKILVLILVLTLLFIAYRIVKFNKLDAKVESFSLNQNEDLVDFSLVDDKLYKIENGKLEAYDSEGQIFSMEGQDMIGLIGDKVVYTFDKTGLVRSFNRENGEEKERLNLEKEIEYAQLQDDLLIVYTGDSVHLLDKKLKEKNRLEDLNHPAQIDIRGDEIGLIELGLEDGQIISSYKLFRNGQTVFSLSSSRELFVFNKIYPNKEILVSNAYLYVIENDTISEKILLENLDAIYANDENLLVGDNEKLRLFDSNIKELVSINLEEEIIDISMREKKIIILGENNLMLYANNNLSKSPVTNPIRLYDNKQATYVVYHDRVDKVNLD